MKIHTVGLWLFGLVLADPSYATLTFKYHAQVVDIVDGNVIVVSNRILAEGAKLPGQATIQLDGVAAPELDQPGGKEAKAFLEKLLKNKEVAVIELTDMGKSRGAWVFIGKDEININCLLIEEGKAWLTEPKTWFAASFSKPKDAYEKMKGAYQKAKDRKVGIWASENPIPPWEWAKKHRSQKE